MLFLWIDVEVKTKFRMPKSSGPKEPWSKVPFSGELSGLLFFSVIVLVWFGFWNGSNLVWLETKIKYDAVYLIPNRTLILVWDFFPHKFLNVKFSVFSIFYCLPSLSQNASYDMIHKLIMWSYIMIMWSNSTLSCIEFGVDRNQSVYYRFVSSPRNIRIVLIGYD